MFAFPAEHPAHHVEDAEQGHVARACPVANCLKLLDEARVIDELVVQVVQVVPPLVVCAGPSLGAGNWDKWFRSGSSGCGIVG